MSTVGPAIRGRMPILLIGNLGQEAPALRQALDELSSTHQEIRSGASSEVLPHLRGAFAEGPGILLLALQGTTGAELSLLKTIKEDEHLRSLPVVVLGPSGDACLVEESFGLGAVGYMASSADPEELTAMMRTVGQYWNLSKLPRQP
jgi:DNA-binding NarL/FixJ family response regulator